MQHCLTQSSSVKKIQSCYVKSMLLGLASNATTISPSYFFREIKGTNAAFRPIRGVPSIDTSLCRAAIIPCMLEIASRELPGVHPPGFPLFALHPVYPTLNMVRSRLRLSVLRATNRTRDHLEQHLDYAGIAVLHLTPLLFQAKDPTYARQTKPGSSPGRKNRSRLALSCSLHHRIGFLAWNHVLLFIWRLYRPDHARSPLDARPGLRGALGRAKFRLWFRACFGGPLLDRAGPRKTIMLSVVGLGASLVLFSRLALPLWHLYFVLAALPLMSGGSGSTWLQRSARAAFPPEAWTRSWNFADGRWPGSSDRAVLGTTHHCRKGLAFCICDVGSTRPGGGFTSSLGGYPQRIGSCDARFEPVCHPDPSPCPYTYVSSYLLYLCAPGHGGVRNHRPFRAHDDRPRHFPFGSSEKRGTGGHLDPGRARRRRMVAGSDKGHVHACGCLVWSVRRYACCYLLVAVFPCTL